MNYIIVDTNVIYNDFFLETPNWRKLLWLNNYENCHVCIPEFVFEEVIKKYSDCITETVNALKRAKPMITKYKLSGVNLEILKKKLFVESYRSRFKELLSTENIEITPYPESTKYISNISKSYFSNKKPFDVNKSSFQDAIIWCSILEFIDKHFEDGDIHFITKNTKDFAAFNDIHKLHPDLEADLPEEARSGVYFYNDISSFLEKNNDIVSEYEEELEMQKVDKIEEVHELVKDYLFGLKSFDANKDLYKAVIDSNILFEYIDGQLLNSEYEGEYGVGWGEDLYFDELSVSFRYPEVEFEDSLQGYFAVYFNLEVDFSIAIRNPLYEDREDAEYIYDSNQTTSFDVQLIISFEIDDSILKIDDINEDNVIKSIMFSGVEINT